MKKNYVWFSFFFQKISKFSQKYNDTHDDVWITTKTRGFLRKKAEQTILYEPPKAEFTTLFPRFVQQIFISYANTCQVLYWVRKMSINIKMKHSIYFHRKRKKKPTYPLSSEFHPLCESCSAKRGLCASAKKKKKVQLPSACRDCAD